MTAGPATPTTDPAPDDATEKRRGILAGVAAYSLWGVFPLVFHQLRDVAAIEVLAHRIAWSFVVVVALLAIRRDQSWLRVLRRPSPTRRRLAIAAALISLNWLVYVWAVAHGQVVQAALGYYINPLITVALGVAVLHERLRRAQAVALVLAVAAVAVLTVAYGNVPWISLVLACSFAGYGFLKKAVAAPALTSLAVETAVLAPAAIAGLIVLQIVGEAAFLHGSVPRDGLLVGLGVVTAAPLLLFGAAARRMPLTLLGLLQYLTPTLQLVCGVVILGEDLPPTRLAGFVLVWAALVTLAADGVADGRRRRRDRGPGAVVEPVADAT